MITLTTGRRGLTLTALLLFVLAAPGAFAGTIALDPNAEVSITTPTPPIVGDQETYHDAGTFSLGYTQGTLGGDLVLTNLTIPTMVGSFGSSWSFSVPDTAIDIALTETATGAALLSESFDINITRITGGGETLTGTVSMFLTTGSHSLFCPNLFYQVNGQDYQTSDGSLALVGLACIGILTNPVTSIPMLFDDPLRLRISGTVSEPLTAFEPGALLMLGFGVLGIAGARRRRAH